ncbi:ATP-binding Cassette (ABC) Superfamily [Thraustotheca clavata]|uniref:ATP-binding Cassette (ABC) Superfamily n=1 Tax=Thraustotheca clavata TaxID=74557 RepID=A0A1W0ACG0_9STRA|nr:ATP-binding Cassette (ABC) Superfamily [Thraustotheca clavata]
MHSYSHHPQLHPLETTSNTSNYVKQPPLTTSTYPEPPPAQGNTNNYSNGGTQSRDVAELTEKNELLRRENQKLIEWVDRLTRRVDELIRQSHLLDQNQCAYYLNFSANCWLGLRLEFAGSMIASCATLCAVLLHSPSSATIAGLAGVSLSYAFTVTPSLNMSVRYLSQLETQMVSVERMNSYTTMPIEPPLHISLPSNAPLDWPCHGEISFRCVDLRYRPGLPRVLRQFTATIHAQEKIGVVGRTGAGKSSLVVALMRLVDIQSGSIHLDGIDISSIGLHDLRQHIAIIPQDPVLFSGTIRFNLDPFHLHSDDELWQAIHRAQLSLSSLDDPVDERGNNLSLGERQLVCIARALVKRAKIILMDEATASIDPTTDRRVQHAIRDAFASCTCLTIAHRLNTIMDADRVLVLDRGSAIEFDSPSILLKRRNSIFASLVAKQFKCNN